MATTSMSGFKVRVPKGGFSAAQKAAISARLSNPKGLKKAAACTLIAFGKSRPAVVQRCEGSTKLTGAAAQARGRRLGNKYGKINIKKVCHKKNGRFVKKGAGRCGK